MKLCKVVVDDLEQRLGLMDGSEIHLLDLTQVGHVQTLKDILFASDPHGLAKFLVSQNEESVPIDNVEVLAPIDRQEVWAAGVTYRRSQVARMEESESAADHYDRVYTADRPEIFFKATPERVSGPDQNVRVRSDSRWTVPEPELALFATPEGQLCGYSIGNDMSARDIEGENPLYLPQAKVYRQCCSLGPCVLVPEEPLDLAATEIQLRIHREDSLVFEGSTALDQMARTFDELLEWLFRENEFPTGVVLFTGTGIVPPDDFSLEDGDSVSIDISGIGTLTNPVLKEEPARMSYGE